MTTQADAEANAPMYYQKATANARRLVAGVNPDQWDGSTPCADWNVKQLVNHMVSGALNVASIMGGDGPQNLGDVLGNDPIKAFDAACKTAFAAFSEPGAMGKMVQTRRGEQLAGDYALGQVQEALAHGWDLAVAIDADTAMDAELMDVSYARALRSRERLRTGGSTAWGKSEANPPENADTQTKYLAILGRSV
jgi:uncharacterized protein (TIGR03086 family)